MYSPGQVLARGLLQGNEVSLFGNATAHAVADEYDTRFLTPYTRMVPQSTYQRLRKVMDIQDALPPVAPVCFVAKSVDSRTLEVGIGR